MLWRQPSDVCQFLVVVLTTLNPRAAAELD